MSEEKQTFGDKARTYLARLFLAILVEILLIAILVGSFFHERREAREQKNKE